MASLVVEHIESDTSNGIFHTPDRDRPLLLPYNRKLRSLRSISLRNLTLQLQHSGRARSGTIDDDADPRSFISPGRLRALREEKVLEHSHSSTDLRLGQFTDSQTEDQSGDQASLERNGSPQSKKHRFGKVNHVRPARLRRRSTIDWANVGPSLRQEKLERLVDAHAANVFFSLHVEGLREPIYVSEIANTTMDPSFRDIDLSQCDAGVQRQQEVVIQLWAQSINSRAWHLVKTHHVAFRELRYAGRTMLDSHGVFEHNSIFFHFTDGIYALPASFSLNHRAQYMSSSPASLVKPLRTSSFDALLRLAKLTDSIEDALATSNTILKDLNNLLDTNQRCFIERDRVAEAEDRLKTIEFAKTTVTKQIEKAKRQIEERKAMLQSRRYAMTSDIKARKDATDEMDSGRYELPQMREEHEIRKKAIAGQHRRIAEDLGEVLSIKPAKDGKALAFTIRGLFLPNAEDADAVASAELGAALGYVSQMVLLLSFYLDIPLPYPIKVVGSSSWISDPISLIKTGNGSLTPLMKSSASTDDKIYPLHLNRVARFRFDYGVFLLNKDIQLLLESGFGVRVLDIRHTLPNLKYLLYIATAGEGELPARKAGGIRGLVKGTGRARLSRESSSSSLGTYVGNIIGRGDASDSKSAASSLQKLVKS